MKIIVIAPASVNHTVKVINELFVRGHEVYLISLSNHREGFDRISQGVKIIYLPFKSPYGYYLNCINLRGIIYRIDPEIINVHFASGYGTLARVSKISKLKPTVLSVWGSDIFKFPLKNSWNKKILMKNLQCSDCIISTSHIMANETSKYLIKDKRLEVIPFGVDLKKFRIRKVNFEQTDIYKIVCIKNLKVVYGVKYLIQAMAILRDYLKGSKVRFELNIYGKGEEKYNLIKLTEELGLKDLVVFRGYIENNQVPEVLGESNICCVPSLRESFGVSIIEAMAIGIPVIATKTDGFKEIIEDDIHGYLVEVENAKAIADKLFFLINNSEKGIELAKNARKKVEDLYNWNKNMKSFEDLLINLKDPK